MTSTGLKIVACLTMLIDHIGAVFFGDIIILRIIGRIAFPIFAYLIAEGFFHTKDVKKYLTRLLIFALVSEIPFNLAFHGQLFDLKNFGLNVFFTLFLALIALYIYDRNKESKIALGILALIIIGILAHLLHTDYGIFGVLIIFGFYFFRGNFIKQSISFIAVTLVMVWGTWDYYKVLHIAVFLQLFAVLSLIFIYIYNGKKGKNIKYLFYIFYPGHLLILGLLKHFILK